MIGYYLHHQGQGHRRRGTAVARALRSDVVGLGSGGAPEGWPGAWVELARDDEPAVDPSSQDVTAGGVLHWVPAHHDGLLRRHRQLVDWVADARPSLVVVDVSVEVALLVRLCGVPVVVGAMPGDRTDRAHRLAYDLADALLAPWPPGAHPDSGWPDAWVAKVWEVGGISALAPQPALHDASLVPPAGGRRVLVVWGSGGDDLDDAALESAAAATPGWTWVVRGGGRPASPDLLADLAGADVVVCHAGQGAVADVALAGRPAVVLAQPRPHDEQLATGRALERMSLAATGVGWPPADAWPDLLERAVDLGGAGWSRWGADGAARAATLLDDLAGAAA
ncbi:glycosyltransferase [Ornithinimicrobium cerasi]|uniref:glycosyltransferase n=1 Tax=Ornithinimicrobium cerasi TaxID=2248773 RepID=UPI000F010586|nr:glycosyltransferase [Ornithinimicrobium cerasi]